jgi:hypothetical protein
VRRQSRATTRRWIKGTSVILAGRAVAIDRPSGRSCRSAALAVGLLSLSLLAFGAGSALAAEPPIVSAGTPQNPSYTTVEVSGTIDPKGGFVEYNLEVSKDGGASWEIPGGFFYPGTNGFINGEEEGVVGPQSIGTHTLEHLKPATTFQFRIHGFDYTTGEEPVSGAPNPEFTTAALADPTLSIDPVTTFTATTAHFSGAVDPNAPAGDPAASDVHWHFTCSPQCPGLGEDSESQIVKASEGKQQVVVDATGLEPNTSYEVKLVGTNAGGSFETALQPFKTLAIAPSATTSPPLLLGGKVNLGGRVDARNSATKYWLEYGPTTAYGTTAPATEDGDAGADGSFHTVTQTLADLQPGATYHVRVVAENSVQRTDGQDIEFTLPVPPDPDTPCPNAAIRAEQQVHLPDCRAYELVSRGNGNFGDVSRVTGASDDGEKVAYVATAADDPAASAFLLPGYVGARSSSGWSTLNANPVAPELAGSGTPRLSQQLAVSSDFSKVLIKTRARLDPRDEDVEAFDLYLVDVPSGKATLVSIGTLPATCVCSSLVPLAVSADLSHVYFYDNNGSLLPGVPPRTTYEWDEGQLSAITTGAGAGFHAQSGFESEVVSGGFNVARLAHNGPHVTSDDGSVLFGGTRHEDSGPTIDPAESQGAINTGTSTFIGASHDGNVLYFANEAQLTHDATPNGGIYRYTHSTNQLALVTPPAGPTGLGITEAVMSDDATHVYFIARAAVAGGAEAGKANLYVQEGAETRFLLTVPDTQARIRRVSRDGRFVILGTVASLAGADTNGHQTFYEVDDQAGVMACVSCRADGSPSQGDATLDDTQPGGVGSFEGQSSPRNISDDGRVFFATVDRLVPEDLDTSSDVYEFFDGTVSLLSGSRGGRGSYVADSGDDGDSAFIVTSEALLPEDRDGGLTDIYDVRSDGGYPNPPTSQTSCEASCRERQGQPVAASIGSELEGELSRKGRITVRGSRSARGVSSVLNVKVNTAGTISLTGPKVQPTSRMVGRAASYQIRAVLTQRARSVLKEGTSIKARVSVLFQPLGERSVMKKVTLTFRPRGNEAKGDAR